MALRWFTISSTSSTEAEFGSGADAVTYKACKRARLAKPAVTVTDISYGFWCNKRRESYGLPLFLVTVLSPHRARLRSAPLRTEIDWQESQDSTDASPGTTPGANHIHIHIHIHIYIHIHICIYIDTYVDVDLDLDLYIHMCANGWPTVACMHARMNERERERERERESFIRNNVHNGVVSGAAW